MNWRGPTDCTGKVAFASYALAARVSKEHRHPGSKFNVYHCTACGKFHVGTEIGRPKDRRREPKRIDAFYELMDKE